MIGLHTTTIQSNASALSGQILATWSTRTIGVLELPPSIPPPELVDYHLLAAAAG